MYFQSIDDKRQCIGVYMDGKLVFEKDKMPANFSGMKTWKYSGSLIDDDVDFAWLIADGEDLEKVCPTELSEEFKKVSAKLRAYKKSFEIAKIDFNDHCFYDLVPHDFLLRFLHLKNQITKHVFEVRAKPLNYDHLKEAHKLLHKIKYQNLNINSEDCRKLFVRSVHRSAAQKLMQGPKTINYNLFGTVTGRLATHAYSVPILTMHRELRQLIKPHNEWFLSLDYNGAELRTALALSGEEQPSYDIHEWNMENVFERGLVNERATAKTLFFSWLYNPDSKAIKNDIYKREKIIEDHYDGECIETIYGRKIKVEPRKAFNYIIQSTTSDMVVEKAVEIDKFLKSHQSFVSHIVHDEIVIDLADKERYLAPQIRDLFSDTRLGNYLVNLEAGKDYYNMEKLKV